MMRFLLLCLVMVPGPALARLEQGQWTFTSTTTSTALKSPQTTMYEQCIRAAEAANPRAWMGQRNATGCQFVGMKSTQETYAWEITCPKAGWKGSGSATVSAKGRAMQAQTRVSGTRFEMSTKVTGKRTGGCR